MEIVSFVKSLEECGHMKMHENYNSADNVCSQFAEIVHARNFISMMKKLFFFMRVKLTDADSWTVQFPFQ